MVAPPNPAALAGLGQLTGSGAGLSINPQLLQMLQGLGGGLMQGGQMPPQLMNLMAGVAPGQQMQAPPAAGPGTAGLPAQNPLSLRQRMSPMAAALGPRRMM